ncbi:glutathione S-transferase [Agaricicola taiwanensis]|uniref:Glutathione S-transferase n=1 Tax=Agaricicola taiwanensis TaxID=591372 RepID=A0A8J2YH39_9RHOB|nr:glutathione S-transferase [Agaricicola taiwanensis]GGE40358.1 glutathione S-transferase [Agaricicola taiwanensis]
MLTLRSSAASPFGRKVKIALELLGLKDQVEVVTADTQSETDTLRQQNPLGKIPALILEDGSALYDSRVIIEYLDWKAGGGKIIPADPQKRFEALRLQALADGMMDAGILRVYEGRFRQPEKFEPKWLKHQEGKMERSLDVLEASPPPAPGPLPHAGSIALACALGWFDFRFDGAWRKDRPKLAAWYEGFRTAVPVFDHYAPK